ncbi:MAG: hypothetical protein ACLQF0_11865 [Dissulfurispiraceae bacterium]
MCTPKERNETGTDEAALECHRIYELEHWVLQFIDMVNPAGIAGIKWK